MMAFVLMALKYGAGMEVFQVWCSPRSLGK